MRADSALNRMEPQVNEHREYCCWWTLSQCYSRFKECTIVRSIVCSTCTSLAMRPLSHRFPTSSSSSHRARRTVRRQCRGSPLLSTSLHGRMDPPDTGQRIRLLSVWQHRCHWQCRWTGVRPSSYRGLSCHRRPLPHTVQTLATWHTVGLGLPQRHQQMVPTQLAHIPTRTT